MDADKKEDKATLRYESLVNRYRKQSTDARRKYYFYQGSLIVLTAITPVFVVAYPDGKWLHALLPALASIVAGYLTLNQFKDQWRRRALAASALQKEYSFFITQCSDYKGLSKDDSICHFVERVEKIVETENIEWATLIHMNENKDFQQENSADSQARG